MSLDKELLAMNENMATSDDRPDENYDDWQLKKGIEIEQEHSSDLEIAKKIAKDHLDEIPDYYTRLVKMEQEAGIDEGDVVPFKAPEIGQSKKGKSFDIDYSDDFVHGVEGYQSPNIRGDRENTFGGLPGGTIAKHIDPDSYYSEKMKPHHDAMVKHISKPGTSVTVHHSDFIKKITHHKNGRHTYTDNEDYEGDRMEFSPKEEMPHALTHWNTPVTKYTLD